MCHDIATMNVTMCRGDATMDVTMCHGNATIMLQCAAEMLQGCYNVPR